MPAGGIAKKVAEASVIAALGTDVAIALAGSEAGRLACSLSPDELLGAGQLSEPGGSGERGITHWQGTRVRLRR